LVLPSRAVGAVGCVGISVNEHLAGRAILTESGTLDTDCSIVACHTVINIVMKFYFISIVSIECVGGTKFTAKINRYFVLVATAPANGTGFRFRSVLIPQWTRFTGNVFDVVSAVVGNVFSTLAEMAGNVVTEVRLVLVVTNGTNLAV
jgi:hypothetical protein